MQLPESTQPEDGASARRLGLVRAHQRLAAISLTFCVTRRCPLRCAHCSQDSGPKLDSPILSAAFGRRVAEELPALRAAGLEYIGFTGGEPTLGRDFVRSVSDACAVLGIRTGILSAAHWAASDRSTHRMLDRLPNISCWDLSTDRYHLAQVPLANLERAFVLLRARGRPALVRFAHHRAPGRSERQGEPALEPQDAELVRRIREFAADQIVFQPVEPHGRGKGLVQLGRRCAGPSLLCLSDGLLVDERGRLLPCASLLATERSEHPLILGDVQHISLSEGLRRWRTHPLLQLMRLGGVGTLLAHAGLESGCASGLRGASDCERCVNLMQDAVLVGRLSALLDEPATSAALAEAVQASLGERWMLESEMTSTGTAGRSSQQ